MLADMESNVLPTAIAWIVQDDGHHKLDDLLFALLRNVTHLYDTKSTNKKRKTASVEGALVDTIHLDRHCWPHSKKKSPFHRFFLVYTFHMYRRCWSRYK